MNNPEASIRVNVDVTNPGQFFACCGLLELADRLWPGAEICGAFDRGVFLITSPNGKLDIARLMGEFANVSVTDIDPSDNAASPLALGAPFNLRLDWWKKVERKDKSLVDLGGGHQLKPWAAKQFGPLIFRRMRAACVELRTESLFNEQRAVYAIADGKNKKKTISPFYFDARRAETSLDIGFSPDEQDMSVNEYPAVESLALVGLQRFRPFVDERGPTRAFGYTVWANELPPAAAMAAACGEIAAQADAIYRFTKPSRGGEYLSMFSRARRERSKNV